MMVFNPLPTRLTSIPDGWQWLLWSLICLLDSERSFSGKNNLPLNGTLVQKKGKYKNIFKWKALKCKPSAQLHSMLQQPAQTIQALAQLGYSLVSCLVFHAVESVYVGVCTHYSPVPRRRSWQKQRFNGTTYMYTWRRLKKETIQCSLLVDSTSQK